MLRRSAAVAVSRTASRSWQPSSRPALYSPWRRWQSNASLKSSNASGNTGYFWTTGRALLFSAFASCLAYAYGITDTGSQLNEIWRKDKAPRYGSAKELEKVCCDDPQWKITHTCPNRLLLSFDVLLAMKRLVRTTMTLKPTASPNGPQSTSTSFLSLLPIPSLPQRFPKLQKYVTNTACRWFRIQGALHSKQISPHLTAACQLTLPTWTRL